MKNTGHHFQLSVTIAVLYWVYHDPNRRAQMVDAIRDTQYRWVILGILAYVVVEVAAAFRYPGFSLDWKIVAAMRLKRLLLRRWIPG